MAFELFAQACSKAAPLYTMESVTILFHHLLFTSRTSTSNCQSTTEPPCSSIDCNIVTLDKIDENHKNIKPNMRNTSSTDDQNTSQRAASQSFNILVLSSSPISGGVTFLPLFDMKT